MIEDCGNKFDMETLIRLLIKEEGGELYWNNFSGSGGVDFLSCPLSLCVEDLFHLSLEGTVPDITINTEAI